MNSSDNEKREAKLRNYFLSQTTEDDGNQRTKKFEEFNPYDTFNVKQGKRKTVDEIKNNQQYDNDDDEDNFLNYLDQVDKVTGRKEQIEIYHKVKGEFRASLHKKRTKNISEKRKTSSEEPSCEFKVPDRFSKIKVEPMQKPWQQVKFDKDASILERAERQLDQLERLARDRVKNPDKPRLTKTPMKSLKRRTNLKFDFDPDESDTELPGIQKASRPQITGKDYLKLFMQKNSTHDADREKANSIVANLQMPNTQEFKENPLFNKDKKLEKELNLHVQDLYSLGQVNKDTIDNQKTEEVYDDQRFQKKLKQEIKKEEDDYDRISSYVSRYDRYTESKTTSAIRTPKRDRPQKDETGQNGKVTKSSKDTTQGDENALNKSENLNEDLKNLEKQQIKKMNLSKLTQQVKNTPNIRLKKAFHNKVMELNQYKKLKKIDQYDSSSLYTKSQSGEIDETRVQMLEQIKEGDNTLLDRNIEFALKMPGNLKNHVHNKFNIQQKELEPYVQYEKSETESVMSGKTSVLDNEKQKTVFDLNYQQYMKQREDIKKKVQNSKNVYKVIQDHLSERSSRRNLGKDSTTDFNDLSSMGSEYPYFPSLPQQAYATPTPQQKSKLIHNKHSYSTSRKGARSNSNTSEKSHQQNLIFKKMQEKQQSLFTITKSTYNDHYKNSGEQCTIEQLETHNQKMKELNRIVKDKISNQVKEVQYEGDGVENLNYFELYKSDFNQKVAEWCENDIKELTMEYQKMNYQALKNIRKIT